jgi:hypothetical protein
MSSLSSSEFRSLFPTEGAHHLGECLRQQTRRVHFWMRLQDDVPLMLFVLRKLLLPTQDEPGRPTAGGCARLPALLP